VSKLYEVVFCCPWRKVATQPGCVPTAWKYKRTQFTVRAKNPVCAAELVIDHMMSLDNVAKHAASCTLDVTEVDGTPDDGIKFSVGGNEGVRYKIRPSRGGGYFPVSGDES
jgi:hypothetical protein